MESTCPKRSPATVMAAPWLCSQAADLGDAPSPLFLHPVHPINHSAFKTAQEFSHVPHLCCHGHLDTARCGLLEEQVSDGQARPGRVGRDRWTGGLVAPRVTQEAWQRGPGQGHLSLAVPLPHSSAPHFCPRGRLGCPQDAQAIWSLSPQVWPPFPSCMCTGHMWVTRHHLAGCLLMGHRLPPWPTIVHLPPRLG